jgi:DNA-binding IclR family transcriptional regulator
MHQCKPLLTLFKNKRGASWSDLSKEIDEARRDIERVGFCFASWQPGVVAVAVPLQVDGSVYVLNVSTSVDEPIAALVKRLAQPLLQLRDEIVQALQDDYI